MGYLSYNCWRVSCTNSLDEIKYLLPAEDLLANLSEDKIFFENALKSTLNEIQIKIENIPETP